jgi:hypothetical protein
MTAPVEIVSDDGTSNLSDETWNAFSDEGSPVVGDGVAADSLTTEDGTAPPPDKEAPPPDKVRIPAAQVGEMLALARWTLVVRANDDKHEVLDRYKLDVAAREEPHIARLRGIGDAEEIAYTQVKDAATKTLAHVRAASSLKLVDLIVTAGGALGYAAAKDRLARPGYMLAAAGAGVLALIASLLLTLWPRRFKLVKLARLDLVRPHYKEMLAAERRAGMVTLAAVVAGLVLAFVSNVPGKSDSAAPAATIELVGTSAGGGEGAIRARLSVAWNDLGESASWVRARVTQSERQLDLRRWPVEDGAVAETFAVDVPKAGDIEVQTAALGRGGRQVGYGSSLVLPVTLR